MRGNIVNVPVDVHPTINALIQLLCLCILRNDCLIKVVTMWKMSDQLQWYRVFIGSWK